MEKNINNMTIKMPHQLFINGEFVDAEAGKTYKTINPTDGMVRTKRQADNEDKMDTTIKLLLLFEFNLEHIIPCTLCLSLNMAFLCSRPTDLK